MGLKHGHAPVVYRHDAGTDKWLWMVEAHAQAGEWAHRSASSERETERQPRH